MQGGGVLDTVRILVTVIIAMFFIEAGVFGYFLKPTSWLERIFFIAGGLFLLSSTLQTDIIGLSLVGLAIMSHCLWPNIPFIGKRPEEPQKVDLSEIKWDDNESILNLNVN